MPPVVVSNAALITLRWNANSVAQMNVLGATVGGTTTIDQTLANTLSTAIKSSFTSILATHIATSVSLVSVGIRDIRSPNLAEFIGTGAPVAGSGTGDPLPRASAICITLRTARAGQSFRGRTYLGGFTEAVNDAGGNIAAAAQTAAVSFITSIGTTFSGNGLVLAVVSRPAERVQIVTTTFHADGTSDVETEVHAARSGIATPVTTVEARNGVWDSQRRRSGPGGGSTLFQPIAQMTIGQSEGLAELNQGARGTRAK